MTIDLVASVIKTLNIIYLFLWVNVQAHVQRYAMQRRCTTIPSHLQKYLLCDSIDSIDSIGQSSRIQNENFTADSCHALYYCIIDKILTELHSHFDDSCDIILCCGCMQP